MAYERVYQATQKIVIDVTEYNKGDVVPNNLITQRMKDLRLVETVKVIPSEDLTDCGEGGCPLFEDTTEDSVEANEGSANVQELLLEDPSEVTVTTEDFVGTTQDTVVEMEIKVKEEASEPDWGWIDTLESTRDDKNKLDDYASEQFGIKLNANRKLDDMVADFKEQLASK